MHLIIIRHAIAEAAPGEEDDAERPLSAEGKKRFRRSVRGLGALGLACDTILHSPLRRAVETAELMHPLLRGSSEEPAVLETPLLACEPGLELTRSILELGRECVAAIGHEPWLSMWLADLLAPGAMRPETVEFKKGGVAWLEGSEPGLMQLRAFLPPKVLRLAGA